MQLFVLNSILYTPEKGIINKRENVRDTMIYAHCEAFSRLGHKVTLFAAKDFEPIDTNTQNSHFKMCYLKSSLQKIFPVSVLPFHPALFSILWKNRNQIDLVITSETFSFNTLFASLIMPSKTIIWQELGQHYQKMRKMPSLIWYMLVAPLMMRKAIFVARSSKAARFLHRFRLPISHTIIDHGVDKQFFYPCQNKQPQFIIVSRLVEGKNIDRMLTCFKKFHSNPLYAHYRLIIAGDGPERERLLAQVKQHNLLGFVNFLGNLTHKQLGKQMGASCAMLCHSQKDLNMISIGEAIACGTPVITNTIPYSSEWIQKEELGIVKDDWDEHEMAQIVNNNSYYVDNCIHVAPDLSLEVTVQKFISVFTKQHDADENCPCQ